MTWTVSSIKEEGEEDVPDVLQRDHDSSKVFPPDVQLLLQELLVTVYELTA